MPRNPFVESSLGADTFLLRRMVGREELGRPYTFDLELYTETPDLDLEAALGSALTVHYTLPNEQVRYFHGYVCELVELGWAERYVRYRASVRPWLWFLTRRSNSRIFQEESVPDIVQKLFREHAFFDFEVSLSETYRPLEYAVQYHESDFNFISRLLEQEGIYYFFKHDRDRHTLVLADGPRSHESRFGYDQVRYHTSRKPLMSEHLSHWVHSQRVQSGAYVVDDYDFKRPRASLRAAYRSPGEHPLGDHEVYDFPGEYVTTEDGESYARKRLEELRARGDVVHAEGDVRGLTAGALFTLTDHPREDQNASYLITSARFELDAGSYEAGSDENGSFACSISALRSSTPFRPARESARPLIAGHQTALVVGKTGEEIWTDEYGRVKVRFPWDRSDSPDEKSSCWVRVAQVWAGSAWGAIHVPRVGQEVLVSFLEGDPDRPIITGRVYNGSSVPPFSLPEQAMVSGIKSESTPGGGGYNEISMHDSKGEERLVVHAQRDLETTVENDKSLTVRRNRSSNVDGEDAETIGQSQAVTVGENQTLKIGKELLLEVGESSVEQIAKSKTSAVGGDYRVDVAGAKDESIEKSMTTVVGGSQSEEVKGDRSVAVGKDLTESASGSIAIASGAAMALDASGDLSLSGKASGTIELLNQLTIKVGAASITLKSSGEITVSGLKVSINGTAEVALTGMKVSHN